MMSRQRTALIASAALFLLFTISVRHHVRGLLDVARTYATFFPWLEEHPDVLFRFPANVNTSTLNGIELTPRILHQIYLSADESLIPAKYVPARESCIDLHPNWTHQLWTNDRAAAFIRVNYPGIYPHYAGYGQNIQRANILRYALLHTYGGVYLDLDVKCLQTLDPLLRLPLLTPGAYPAGINNAFILARPKHGFFEHLIRAVPSQDLRWGMPYIENMLSTGCMFFSNRWMEYMRATRNGKMPVSEAETAYILADENGDMNSHMLRGVITTPLFHHAGASSWHQWDAAIIVLIGKYYGRFLFGLAMLITVIATFSIAVATRRRRERSKTTWSPKVRAN